MDEEREKMPAYNPLKVCPKCKQEYTVYGYYFNSQEKKWKVGHNFVPTSQNLQTGKEGAGITEICMKCKMGQVVARDEWTTYGWH